MKEHSEAGIFAVPVEQALQPPGPDGLTPNIYVRVVAFAFIIFLMNNAA